MRTTLITLLLASIASLAPAHAAAPMTCKSAYCATLPNNEERMELLAYLADRKGAAIAASPAVCGLLSGAHRTGCAVLQGMVADARRAEAYNDLAKGWSIDSRAAFGRLLVAEDAYARAVGDNEVDRMSPASGADAIIAAQSEKDAFLRTLETVAGGTARLTFIASHHGDAPGLDDALNTAYQQVMAVGDTSNLAWGSVETSGIQRTQRAWLAYRDAFVAFAATIDTDAVEVVTTQLTTRRVVGLDGFLQD